MRSLNAPRGSIALLPRAVVWIAAAIFLAGCGGGNSDPVSSTAASLSYPSAPMVFVVDTAITPVTPSASSGLSSFTVTPALPAGLSLDPGKGTISGTPTTVAVATTYTVTATGAGGNASATVSITVNAAAPSSLSYGAPAFTFTTNVTARTLTPSASGGAISGWSINPALPAGLTFDPSTGVIGGTPTAASAAGNWVVTAQNSSGQTTVTLSIEVDSGVLLDLGHVAGISVLRMSGSSVLSLDQSGHWNLWDYTSGSAIASGDIVCPSAPDYNLCQNAADMAGGTAVLATQSGFEVISATTGQVLANITAVTPNTSWWKLASDGSYLSTGSSAGLSVWSPSGSSALSVAGDYSKALVFADPGQIQVADGPAGQTVIETVALPGGAATTGPAFNGQFSSWFLDGSRFITTAGSTTLVYSQSSVQQAAVSLPSGAGPAVGQGNWVWTVVGAPLTGTLEVFPIATGSTPAASFPTAGAATPSGTTIGVVNSSGFGVIDLSGATPTETQYTLPPSAGSVYAAVSTSQWMLGSAWGVLVDGASLSGTPRYFDYGAAWSIAGSNGSIAVATASGRIVYFDASTLAQEGAIAFPASQVLLSSDGSVLAAAGDEKDAGANNDWSIRIYTLPAGGLTYTWPYSFSNGIVPQNMSLSGSGTVLGQVIENFTNSNSITDTQQAAPTTGGSPIFSSTDDSTRPGTANGQLQAPMISPDGTLIAAATAVTSGVNPGTDILQNGSLVTAVTGFPVGWIDNGHLLVNTYALQESAPDILYAGCSVYSPTGQSTGPCAMPQEVTTFQAVTSDSIYAVNLAEVLSVGTGNVSWMSGDSVSQSVGALAGSRVVLLSGTQILAQEY